MWWADEKRVTKRGSRASEGGHEQREDTVQSGGGKNVNGDGKDMVERRWRGKQRERERNDDECMKYV